MSPNQAPETAPDAGAAARPPLRVAVVGLGWAAREIWLRRLRAHPGYTVAALVDPDPAARAAAGADTPGALLSADVAELDPAEVGLAIVAVPNHMHSAIAGRLLERGVPAFVEKPVCLTSEQAGQLAEAERRGGAVLLAGSAAAYRTDVRAFHEAVRTVGPLRHLEVSWVRARGVPDAGGWFTRRSTAGGGALLDLGWHLLDAVGPLLGPARFDQVVATTSDDFLLAGASGARWRGRDGEVSGADTSDASDASGDVEDTARGFLVTADGVSVALRASWASHEPHDVTLMRADGARGSVSLRCTFGFSPNRRGGPVLAVTRDGAATEVAVPAEAIGAEYDRQLDDLPALLADPGSRGRAAAQAARTVAVIERLYDSARRARAALAVSP